MNKKPPFSSLKVGSRITVERRLLYSKAGEKGAFWHTTKALAEIDEVHPAAVNYKVIEILEERGRPEGGARDFTVGGFAAYAWDSMDDYQIA